LKRKELTSDLRRKIVLRARLGSGENAWASGFLYEIKIDGLARKQWKVVQFKNATNEPTMLLKTLEIVFVSHDLIEFITFTGSSHDVVENRRLN
jgi:hypothetical protein